LRYFTLLGINMMIHSPQGIGKSGNQTFLIA